MKRYLVFAWYEYCPHGGWHDFVASCASLEEATGKAEEAYMTRGWVQIVDLESLDIVEEKPASHLNVV